MEIKGTFVPFVGHLAPTPGEHSTPEGAHHPSPPQQPWPAAKRRAWPFPPSGAGSLPRWRGNTSSTCPKAPPPGPVRSWSSSRRQKVLCWRGHTLWCGDCLSLFCCFVRGWSCPMGIGQEVGSNEIQGALDQGDREGGHRGGEHITTSTLASCS